jgi:O-antigen/teichoic acid export membrane protein
MSSLKQKTVSGLLWSFIDNFSKLGLTFIIGIILARLLSPGEFGLIGMISIFIALSQSLVDSGFTQALIRKKECTQADYSTVFYFNLLVGFVLYLVLYFSAPAISRFFEEPQLTLIVKVIGLGIVINAFTIVQRARLTKEINFKLQTKISIIASVVSGTIGIVMAYSGYGVWSLVFKTLMGFFFSSVLLWIWNKWKPTLVFSKNSFKELFSFGYRLLLSGLIDTVYKNIYLLIIGKYFSAAELGFYTRADQFNNLPSSNITSVIQRVSYPILTEIQDDLPRLKIAYQKIIKSTMLISFVAMMIMAAVAKPLILSLIGEKWLPSVIYLQLLSFVGMLYPLHAINLNMLNVQGRSDLFLRLEIIKKILAIPVIIVGVLLGIKLMIVAMIFLSLIAYFLNSYYSGQLIGYSSLQQVKDIFPSFVLAAFIGLVIYSLGIYLTLPNYVILITQLLSGGFLFFTLAELFKMKDYEYVKEIFVSKFLNRKTGKQ